METFAEEGMKEMQSTPCVFQNDGIIAICDVDDLVVFAETKKVINQLKQKIGKDLVVEDLGLQKSFLG